MVKKSGKEPTKTGQNSFLIKKNAAVNDWSIHALPAQNGPPVRADGMTVGIIDMTTDAPHNGEMHPDGDELLYVISGSVEVTSDESPDALILGPNESCIIAKGEWHNVHVVEPAKLIHITPGPGGEHRPLA